MVNVGDDAEIAVALDRNLGDSSFDVGRRVLSLGSERSGVTEVSQDRGGISQSRHNGESRLDSSSP